MRQFLMFAVMFAVALPCVAQSVATPQERLSRIAAANALVGTGKAPFHLVLAFQLYDMKGKPTTTGTIDLRWLYENRYQVKVTTPAESWSEPETGDPPLTRDRFLVDSLLKNFLQPVPDGTFDKLTKVSVAGRKLGGKKFDCLTTETKASSRMPASERPAFCVDPGTDTLRFHEWDGMAHFIRDRVGKFAGTDVAMEETLSYDRYPGISGKVTTLESLDPASAGDISPTEDSLVDHYAGRAGRRTGGEAPEYPSEARHELISGIVLLVGRISKEGKTAALIPISSPDESLTQSALKAVRTWTYEPHLTDGKPSESWAYISIHFGLR